MADVAVFVFEPLSELLQIGRKGFRPWNVIQGKVNKKNQENPANKNNYENQQTKKRSKLTKQC